MRNVRPDLLIVDDALPIGMSLPGMPTALHYAVRVAPDGFAALTEILKKIPSLILSELNMPGMSGFELLSVVRRRFPSIRVIAMSGAFSGWGVPAEVAADAFYPKESHPTLLLRMMEDITRSTRAMLSPGTSSLAPVLGPEVQHFGRAVCHGYLSRVSQDVLTGFGQERWFASQSRLRPLPQPDSLCDCPLVEFALPQD